MEAFEEDVIHRQLCTSTVCISEWRSPFGVWRASKEPPLQGRRLRVFLYAHVRSVALFLLTRNISLLQIERPFPVASEFLSTSVNGGCRDFQAEGAPAERTMDTVQPEKKLDLWAVVAELLLFVKIVLLAIEHLWDKHAMCHSEASMEGKTVIVTGATSGIGKETAMELARRKARVIIACRNAEKAQHTAEQIFEQTKQRVVVKALDMTSFKSVHRFCDDIVRTEDRLDVLINNAGAIGHSKKVKLTEDGFEEIFQANFLAPLLLTLLLLDLLKKSSPSRIINVSSDYHRLGQLGDVRQMARGVNLVTNPTALYGNAKLALCLVTIALADRLRGTGVTVNSLHPGAVKTHIVDEGPGLRKFLFDFVLSIKGKTPLEGAQTSVRLAVDPELANTSGEYFENCAPAAPRYRSAHLADHHLAEHLLRSSQQLLGL